MRLKVNQQKLIGPRKFKSRTVRQTSPYISITEPDGPTEQTGIESSLWEFDTKVAVKSNTLSSRLFEDKV